MARLTSTPPTSISQRAAVIMQHVYNVATGKLPPDNVASLKMLIMVDTASKKPNKFLLGIYRETCAIMSSQGATQTARIASLKQRLKQCASEWRISYESEKGGEQQ